MRVSTLKLFDETISGTATTWYTPSETYDPLGRGDMFTFAAAVYNVTGGPNLNVQVEHSSDGQNWVSPNGTVPEISSVPITSNQVLVRQRDGVSPVLLSFVRLKAWLAAGTSPQCRLKLTATTRNL